MTFHDLLDNQLYSTLKHRRGSLIKARFKIVLFPKYCLPINFKKQTGS